MNNRQKIYELFDKVDYQKIHSLLTEFIKNAVGNKQIIIGLSGGIDSTLTCSLAVDALGSEKVKVLIVKNIRYSNENLNVARKYANKLGVDKIEIDSNIIRNYFLTKTKIDRKDHRQVASLDARITDLLIRTIASQENRIYLGTINGTEKITGWYPKGSLFGDFCPIAGLLKHQIQRLAMFCKLPEGIVDSVSGDASQVCSGCGELPEFRGIPYDILDAVLYIYETEKSENYRQKINDLKISQKSARIILNRIGAADHKSQIFCPYPKVNY